MDILGRGQTHIPITRFNYEQVAIVTSGTKHLTSLD